MIDASTSSDIEAFIESDEKASQLGSEFCELIQHIRIYREFAKAHKECCGKSISQLRELLGSALKEAYAPSHAAAYAKGKLAWFPHMNPLIAHIYREFIKENESTGEKTELETRIDNLVRLINAYEAYEISAKSCSYMDLSQLEFRLRLAVHTKFPEIHATIYAMEQIADGAENNSAQDFIYKEFLKSKGIDPDS